MGINLDRMEECAHFFRFNREKALVGAFIRKHGLDGRRALADALCKITKLIFLDISWNKLESDGGRALVYMLCKNTTLSYLGNA